MKTEKKQTSHLKIGMFIEVPMVPNFVRLKGAKEMTFPIHRMTDNEIKELGSQWTEKLLERARQNRKHLE